MPGIKLKDAALAEDDLLRQSFRYDELAPKTSSGEGSQPSNGGMHLGGMIQSAGWTRQKNLKPNDDGHFLIQYRASARWALR